MAAPAVVAGGVVLFLHATNVIAAIEQIISILFMCLIFLTLNRPIIIPATVFVVSIIFN